MKNFDLLPLGMLVALLPSYVAAAGNCTTFNWDQSPGYIINGTTSRVSAAMTCPERENGTHACLITASGDLSGSFRFRKDSSIDFEDSSWSLDSYVHGLVLKEVNSTLAGQRWPYTTIGTIDTAEALSPNTSAYLNFTNFQRCFEGTMSGCDGGLQDGFSVQACAPVVSPIRGGVSAPPVLDGIYTVVEIPADMVTRYGNNPFGNQVRGSSGRIQSSLTAVILGLAMTSFAWL